MKMQSILSKPFCSAAHWPFFRLSVYSARRKKARFYENRRLAVFPVPSVETVLDGTFFSNVETYISDHFAYRVPLLRLNVRKELALHNPVVSNTVIAGDTLLPYHGRPRTDYDHENMQTVLDALSQVSAACETVGAKFVYLSIPEQSSAFAVQISVVPHVRHLHG